MNNRCEWSDLPNNTCDHCRPPVEPIGLPLPTLIAPRVRVIWPTPDQPVAPKPKRHHPAPAQSGADCRCGRPAGDAYLCPHCADDLSDALNHIPELLEELDIVLAQQVRYVTGSSKHGKPEGRLPINPAATEARGLIANALTTAYRLLDDAYNLTDLDTEPTLNDLAWLIGGMTHSIRLQPFGPDVLDEILAASAAAERVIDRPRTRHYLGDCTDQHSGEKCPGRMMARANERFARCDTCGNTRDADDLRAGLLKELDERLCTAAEIATLSTYLGLDRGRAGVRKLINQWHTRGRIESRGTDDAGNPRFGFGKVYELLVQDDTERTAKPVVVTSR